MFVSLIIWKPPSIFSVPFVVLWPGIKPSVQVCIDFEDIVSEELSDLQCVQTWYFKSDVGSLNFNFASYRLSI